MSLQHWALGFVVAVTLASLGILVSLLPDELSNLVKELWSLDQSTYFLALVIGSLSSFPVLFFQKSSGAAAAPKAEPGSPGRAPPKEAEAPKAQAAHEAPPQAAPKVAPKVAPKRAKPLSPRSQARELVGTRMSEEQATKAAEKILALRPYVDRQNPIDLEEMWAFFNLDAPQSRRSLAASDPLLQQLKSKLNRQRLLFHPDKNGHPEAEKTFKFLEVCHQKLMTAYTRQSESIHQRTRREEEELKQEEARRQKQEEERRAQMELLEREEEEKVRRLELHRQRLDEMLEAKRSAFEAKQTQVVSRSSDPLVSLFTSCRSSKTILCKEDAEETSVIGRLSVRLRARDLPCPEFLFAGNHYAVVSVGDQILETRSLSGLSCEWEDGLLFQIHRINTSLAVSVFREGWLHDSLLGKTEVPFLDIEEWSGHWMGRLLENGDPQSMSLVELQASFEWY